MSTLIISIMLLPPYTGYILLATGFALLLAVALFQEKRRV
jgi:hypothetical protein